MEIKALSIETAEAKEEFEIDEFGGKFYVYKLLADVRGARQSKKISDAVSLDGAVELAKVFISKPVINIRIKEE